MARAACGSHVPRGTVRCCSFTSFFRAAGHRTATDIRISLRDSRHSVARPSRAGGWVDGSRRTRVGEADPRDGGADARQRTSLRPWAAIPADLSYSSSRARGLVVRRGDTQHVASPRLFKLRASALAQHIRDAGARRVRDALRDALTRRTNETRDDGLKRSGLPQKSTMSTGMLRLCRAIASAIGLRCRCALHCKRRGRSTGGHVGVHTTRRLPTLSHARSSSSLQVSP